MLHGTSLPPCNARACTFVSSDTLRLIRNIGSARVVIQSFAKHENSGNRPYATSLVIHKPRAERIGMDAVKTELQGLACAQFETEAFDQARLIYSAASAPK